MANTKLAAPMGLLLLSLALGCARKPDQSDARGALTVLRSLSDPAIDAKTALRVRYQGCAELPGCAAGCADALTFCATPDSDEAQRGAVLGKCFSGVDRAAADQWFRGHFDRFIEASRPLLTAAERREFDAARAKVK